MRSISRCRRRVQISMQRRHRRTSCAGSACGSSPMCRRPPISPKPVKTVRRRRGGAARALPPDHLALRASDDGSADRRTAGRGRAARHRRRRGGDAAAGRRAGNRACWRRRENVSIEAAAGAYFAVGAQVGLDTLRGAAARIAGADHWDRLALTPHARRSVHGPALARGRCARPRQGHDVRRGRFRPRRRGRAGCGSKTVRQTWSARARFLAELEKGGQPSVAKLSLANSQIQKIAAAAPSA